MDWLAGQNLLGVHDPVQSGLACGSDTAHMSIFGYDPLKLYNGRGAFESLGAGLQMEPGEIAFKSNFSFMNLETNIVERRRVDRTFPDWGIPLCDAINNLPIPGYPDYVLSCMYATEHRCGIKISGKNLSSEITGTDPLKDDLPLLKCEPINPDDADAVFTSNLVNAVSKAITERLL